MIFFSSDFCFFHLLSPFPPSSLALSIHLFLFHLHPSPWCIFMTCIHNVWPTDGQTDGIHIYKHMPPCISLGLRWRWGCLRLPGPNSHTLWWNSGTARVRIPYRFLVSVYTWKQKVRITHPLMRCRFFTTWKLFLYSLALILTPFDETQVLYYLKTGFTHFLMKHRYFTTYKPVLWSLALILTPLDETHVLYYLKTVFIYPWLSYSHPLMRRRYFTT